MGSDLKGLGVQTIGAAAMALLGEQRTIAYRASLTRICGGAPGAGVLLAQLLFWAPKVADESGWFRITAADLSSETGMSDEAIKTAGRRIEERGFIARSVRGLPATTHYKIKYRELIEAIAQDAAEHPASRRRGAQVQPVARQSAPPAAGSDAPYMGNGVSSVSGVPGNLNPGNLNPGSSADKNPGIPDAINERESESDVKEAQPKKRPGRPRKVRADGAPLPDPQSVDLGHPALNLYRDVTGRRPGKHVQPKIIASMPAGATVESLRPYWDLLLDRGGNPMSLYWLSDWAARGIAILPNGAGKGKGRGRGDDGESVEYRDALVIKAAAEAAGGAEIESESYLQACAVLARGSGAVIDVSARGAQG